MASAWMEDAEEVSAVMSARSAHPFSLAFLILLAPGFQQFALGKAGLACELDLVLLADPVSSLMVAYFMLQDYDFKHFLCFSLGELAL